MTKQWHGGKGSKRRQSNEQAYRDNWEEIFRKNKNEGKKTKSKNTRT